MNLLGLFFEVIFFAGGTYLFLLSTGFIKVHDRDTNKWLDQNRRWLTPGSAALAVIMLLNILLGLMGK